MSDDDNRKQRRWWDDRRLGNLARGVFVLLLIANVGAVAVAMLRDDPAPPPPPPAPASSARLVLVSEHQGVLDSATGRLDTVPNADCYSLGPFATEQAMNTALDRIAPLADVTRERRLTTATQEGFVVMIDPAADRESALAGARELNEAGIRDYYVITAGDDENAISLGLYRDEVNAQRRQRQLAQAGFETRLIPRRTTFPVFWLDYAELPDRPIDWETLLVEVPDLARSPIPCF